MGKENRIKAREQAFFFCFGMEFSHSLDEVIEAYSEDEPALDFAVELSKGCVEKTAECDEIIKRHLKKWKLSRISKISRTLLRLAVYQLAFAKELTGGDNPTGVIINDAVRLAKEYATEEDAAFINGVLGSVVKELDGEPAGEKSQPEEGTEAEEKSVTAAQGQAQLKAEGEDE